MESVINEEIFDTVNAIRLACKGNRLPHYYSTRGTTLFTTDKGDNTFFFFLQWTNWQTEESQIVPCNKEEAFHFLYDLYGSSYTDTTDEDLDEILKKYFPNRTIAG